MSNVKSIGKVPATIALGCLLAGAGLGIGGVMAYDTLGATSAVASTIQIGNHEGAALGTDEVDTSGVKSAREIYAQNVDATVAITTTTTTGYRGYYTTSTVTGSGFIVTEDGFVVTNYHVVKSADTVSVTLYDSSVYDAVLVGYDEENDVAVLKIDATGLQAVVFGDSDALAVGEDVYAIGNPMGMLPFSMTRGIVSGLDRQVRLSNGLTMDLIQTDCAINSGNSGGPLFNEFGEVIGITNAHSDGTEYGEEIDNIGFAIPTGALLPSIQQIIEEGVVTKPFIGVYVNDVSSVAGEYGVSQGALVSGLVDGGTAEAAGLLVNDVVTAIDGREIADAEEFVEVIGGSEIGAVLSFTVYRDGETLTVEVPVGQKTVTDATDPAGSDDAAGSGSYDPWGGSWGIMGGPQGRGYSGYGYDYGYGLGGGSLWGWLGGFGW